MYLFINLLLIIGQKIRRLARGGGNTNGIALGALGLYYKTLWMQRIYSKLACLSQNLVFLWSTI